MSNEFIKVEKDGHLTTITIDRPEVMNSIHPATSHELDRAFNDFQSDPEQWVGIVTGAGDRAFSAGNDLKYQAKHGSAKLMEESKGLVGGFAGITRRFDLVKPLIAAVNGFAMGGGFEIALACDIIVASEKATFALPEPRVGLMAAAGGVHRLPRQIPYHLAMGMILTGRRVSAAEGKELGFVNEVVAPEDLMSAAKKWAELILECSPLAVRASKESSQLGLHLAVEEAMGHPFEQAKINAASSDYVEGPKAFAEKRKPEWKGA